MRAIAITSPTPTVSVFRRPRIAANLKYVTSPDGLFNVKLGVLMTAIMVAGRSGSAFTAEIGSMKMREEIDALRVMGLDPIEVLIVPRIMALVIGLPLLTFIASIAALVGGGLTTWVYGDISPDIFLNRLRAAVDFASDRGLRLFELRAQGSLCRFLSARGEVSPEHRRRLASLLDEVAAAGHCVDAYAARGILAGLP